MENRKDTYLLLGPQEVGKTCFLAGLYYTFRSSLNGFSLSCANEEQKISLNMLCGDLDKGKFPQGTGGSTNYHFNLRKAHQERFSFDWYDYRGKLLEEYGTYNQDEYDELVDKITSSTCILICVDGSWLSDDKNKMVKTIQDNSFFINDFLDKYIDDIGMLPPICVVITKYDLCDWKYEQLYFEAIMESFAFFENFRTPIFICPICIGNFNDESGKFMFDPTDQDIYKPLFYALWCGYSYRIGAYEKEYFLVEKNYNALINTLKKEIKKIDDRVISFNKRNRINSKQNDINKYEKILRSYESKISILKNEQKELFEALESSEGIYMGSKNTTWEEVDEKWKFIQ